jgi:hypothetical protein
LHATVFVAFAVIVALVLLVGATSTADLSELQTARRVLPPTVTWALSCSVAVTALGLAVALAVRNVFVFGQRRSLSGATVAVALLLLLTAGTSGPLTFGNVYAVLGGDTTRFVSLGARWVGAFGGAAALLIVAAFLHLVPSGGEVTPESQRERIASARELLYVSAVGLAAGIIGTFSRLILQVDPALDEVGRQAALSVVQAATIAYGGFFTLLLLGSYAPVSYFISQSSVALATAHTEVSSDPVARNKWLQENGLQDSALARVLKILAAFLPLLASTLSGPLASVLQELLS